MKKQQPQKIFIQPAAKDLVVRIPERGNRQLKAEGEFVTPGTYWTRRLSHGDVKLATPPKKATGGSGNAGNG